MVEILTLSASRSGGSRGLSLCVGKDVGIIGSEAGVGRDLAIEDFWVLSKAEGCGVCLFSLSSMIEDEALLNLKLATTGREAGIVEYEGRTTRPGCSTTI